MSVTEVGLWLPRNRLRAPDLTAVTTRPTATWVEEPPVLVVEVPSASTRSEDTIRKAPEYAEGGVGQFWVVDPDARAVDVHTNAGDRWELLLRLDAERPTGEVAVGEHGVVPLDLAALFPADAAAVRQTG